jgi:hypothetical protein
MPNWGGGHQIGPPDSTLHGVVFAVFVSGARAVSL